MSEHCSTTWVLREASTPPLGARQRARSLASTHLSQLQKEAQALSWTPDSHRRSQLLPGLHVAGYLEPRGHPPEVPVTGERKSVKILRAIEHGETELRLGSTPVPSLSEADRALRSTRIGESLRIEHSCFANKFQKRTAVLSDTCRESRTYASASRWRESASRSA